MRAPKENPIGFNNQFVALFPQVCSCSIRRQENPTRGGNFSRQEGQLESGGRSETICEELPNEANFLPVGLNKDGRVGAERICSFSGLDRGRERNQVLH